MTRPVTYLAYRGETFSPVVRHGCHHLPSPNTWATTGCVIERRQSNCGKDRVGRNGYPDPIGCIRPVPQDRIKEMAELAPRCLFGKRYLCFVASAWWPERSGAMTAAPVPNDGVSGPRLAGGI